MHACVEHGHEHEHWRGAGLFRPACREGHRHLPCSPHARRDQLITSVPDLTFAWWYSTVVRTRAHLKALENGRVVCVLYIIPSIKKKKAPSFDSPSYTVAPIAHNPVQCSTVLPLPNDGILYT